MPCEEHRSLSAYKVSHYDRGRDSRVHSSDKDRMHNIISSAERAAGAVKCAMFTTSNRVHLGLFVINSKLTCHYEFIQVKCESVAVDVLIKDEWFLFFLY